VNCISVLEDIMSNSELYFVVGSPRSGTKIFRDSLQAFPEIRATNHPLEEIWTYGQNTVTHEAYSPDSITPNIRETIRNRFQEYRNGTPIFVEKNVRNSLRIPYIREIFPEARFIHIVRNPLDVIVSLRERWKNPIDWSYYLSSKALELSVREIVEYTLKLGGQLLKRLLKGRKHVDVWGPHYPGLLDDLREKSLLEVCALQWKYCTANSRKYGDEQSENYFELHYETLMKNPEAVLKPLSNFMNLSSPEPGIKFAKNNFRTDSIGRGKNTFTTLELKNLENCIGTTANTFGYKSFTE
jgi:hypothetical protein